MNGATTRTAGVSAGGPDADSIVPHGEPVTVEIGETTWSRPSPARCCGTRIDAFVGGASWSFASQAVPSVPTTRYTHACASWPAGTISTVAGSSAYASRSVCRIARIVTGGRPYNRTSIATSEILSAPVVIACCHPGRDHADGNRTAVRFRADTVHSDRAPGSNRRARRARAQPQERRRRLPP